MRPTSKRPPLIVLLTDFGTRDEYVGVMKGVISSINPEARTIDLSHDLHPHDIMEAGFMLYRSYRFFPEGTIFLVVVDPGVGTERRIIIIRQASYYFLAPDNGVLSFIFKKEEAKMVVWVTKKGTGYFLPTISRTFHGRDCFAPIAAHLSKGVALAKFGREIDDPTILHIPAPSISLKNSLVGEVIYIDRFGNLITNIDYETFEDFQKRHPKKLLKVRVGRKIIPKLSSSYRDAGPNELLAIYGSSNHLEISLNLGSAKDSLRANKGTRIEVSP